MDRYSSGVRVLKILAVVFGFMSLLCLVFIPSMIYNWRESVRSEAEYKVAPVCTSAEQTGCRREWEAVFNRKYYTSSRSKGTYHVSLTMPAESKLNGDIPVWHENDHSLYESLKPGDRVTAEEWEGQIAAIRGADQSTLRTEYNPTYRREDAPGSLFGIFFASALIFFAEYKIIARIRKGP